VLIKTGKKKESRSRTHKETPFPHFSTHETEKKKSEKIKIKINNKES
jgi:hypothetical protein